MSAVLKFASKGDKVALAVAADELGLAKSRIAEEKKLEEELKAVFIEAAANGFGETFEGEAFRVSVSFANKPVTDYQEVISHLADEYGIPAEAVEKVLRRFTKVAKGVPCVRVGAKKGV